MRLLKREPDGELVLTRHNDKSIPVYAILSHTWHTNDSEEVSLQDFQAGSGKSKAGWKKIRFCAEQVASDGLQYFWIDTCCIDRKDAVELSAAINSMFRWYQKATRCYVYLADVSIHHKRHYEENKGQFHPLWEPAFRKSRWFTRGWTLQELVAPTHVDFYSLE